MPAVVVIIDCARSGDAAPAPSRAGVAAEGRQAAAVGPPAHRHGQWARAGGARRADVDDGVVEAWGAASTVPSPGLGTPGIIPLDIERDMWMSFAAVRRRRAVRLAKIGLAAVRSARRACMHDWRTMAGVVCPGTLQSLLSYLAQRSHNPWLTAANQHHA